jgi:hypothetical protein
LGWFGWETGNSLIKNFSNSNLISKICQLRWVKPQNIGPPHFFPKEIKFEFKDNQIFSKLYCIINLFL